ncbi:unnamed protein product [Rhizoctonia solani]|uniref:Uncharacterized protein n=1 Tax=Rhizoctonia solani TaxID=456999 RepID=A0A8H3C9E7_9AGAM|nr:unnamed protein product [Rhizoctonia solani]
MRFGIPSFLTLAVVASAAAQSTERFPSINPPLSVVRNVDFASLPAAPEPATNAERFAQGLPPIRPRNLHLKQGTRAASAPRAETSPVPAVEQKCNVVARTKDTTLGYLVPQLNAFGQYGRFQASQAGSLQLSVLYVPGSDAPVDLYPVNGPTKAYPYVGGAMGIASDSDDLSPGSSNYAYVVATRQTPPGSPAVAGDNSSAASTGIPADFESAIWIYNPTTNQFRPQWVNADGSTPTTYHQDGNDALILTGDPEAVNNAFGTSYPQITLTCVPVAA